MVVMHNLMAMNGNRMLGITGNNKKKSIEKLSSGYRVNRAADDAAGLAISEKMRRQIRGLTQGVENTQEGVSLCQVADGALNEVADMLNRMEELAVKAANGTNTPEDREYIQQEIQNLVSEIDRISDTTTYNELPLFKGADNVMTNPDGSAAIESAIPFTDFKMADLSLGQGPFDASSGGNTLGLRAIVDNASLAANGKNYNLIFGDGSTSRPSLRLNYDGKSVDVNLTGMASTNFQTGTDTSGKSWCSRDFKITNADGINITLTQKVSINEDTDSDKNYKITYSLQNDSDKVVSADFMFHVDTAYNNNDTCEAYFIDGNRVDKYSVYSEAGSKFTNGIGNPNIIEGVPSSFSIVDVDNALAFTEKIQIDGSNPPDSLSVGHYNEIHQWSYYDNLDSNLGRNAIRSDLGFSLMWNDEMSSGATTEYSFLYGISAVETDNNLHDVSVQKSDNHVTEHSATNPIWIQSGSEPGVGMDLIIEEMNSDVLGISGMNVSTEQGAQAAINQTKIAQRNIMGNRSNIGAQQNRLEHTIRNENNIVENTTAAESAIRDADMATEMVKFSNHNILEQAGTSMLAQANQSNQGVLSLLQ